jgi:ubiquinone/menaquinone biosynthesis C-methylase UbiE
LIGAIGFPLLEIAARVGAGLALGIDPWRAALERARRKAETRALASVRLYEGVAEALPLADRTVDLIVSNNGINNVPDLDRARAWRARGRSLFLHSTCRTACAHSTLRSRRFLQHAAT